MLKKIFFGVIFILIICLSNLVTHNYTVNLIKNDYDIVIKDCFINKEKSSNIKIDIIKEENGFITKIKNESDCYNLEKLELKIESLNKGSADTVYININKNDNYTYLLNSYNFAYSYLYVHKTKHNSRYQHNKHLESLLLQ